MTLLSILLQIPETLNNLKVGNVSSHLTFFELIRKGGVILIPIGLLSVIAIYLIAEKYYVIHQATRIDVKTKNEVKVCSKGETDKALSHRLDHKQGSYATIFRRLLKNTKEPVKELESEVESVSNIQY